MRGGDVAAGVTLTDDGVLKVWDGPRLLQERQMTIHELTALQKILADAISRAVCRRDSPKS